MKPIRWLWESMRLGVYTAARDHWIYFCIVMGALMVANLILLSFCIYDGAHYGWR